MTPSYGSMKRLLDLGVAVVAIVILAFPLLVVAALITRKLGPGGPFFRQVRPGLGERPFRVLKFRTMREAYDDAGEPLPDIDRTPPLGWFLRRHSIDELPQMINVLRGEMSLVGPRPLLLEYLDRYPPEYRRRHDVLPGITGWAQVNGRDFATFKQRLDMDLWYVDHRSLATDLKILWLTVTRVVLKPSIAPLDQDMAAVDDLGLYRPTDQVTRLDARPSAGDAADATGEWHDQTDRTTPQR